LGSQNLMLSFRTDGTSTSHWETFPLSSYVRTIFILHAYAQSQRWQHCAPNVLQVYGSTCTLIKTFKAEEFKVSMSRLKHLESQYLMIFCSPTFSPCPHMYILKSAAFTTSSGLVALSPTDINRHHFLTVIVPIMTGCD